MDFYGAVSTSAPDYFPIDDLLDFSNDDLLTSSTDHHHHHHLPPPVTSSIHHHHHFPSTTYINNTSSDLSADFTDHLSVPSDDVAELEWLSQFMEDSFTDFPSTINIPADTSSRNISCGKGSRTTTAATSSSADSETAVTGESRLKKGKTERHILRRRRKEECGVHSLRVGEDAAVEDGSAGSENAMQCVRSKVQVGSARARIPTAASPTFVLTQHSNSHRKVLELRRQKEMMLRLQQQHGYQGYEVC
ncbi:GATA transcription factor [Salix suchowensis]|nr:GATA transcription factor [Salix suchowensis]